MQWTWFQRSPKSRSVLITGCDSGFGKLLAEKLFQEGSVVYAGCLTSQGCETLNKLCPSTTRMKTFKIDITNDKSVAEARDFVFKDLENSPDGLWGLINNAGILKGYFIEFTPIDTFQQLLDVNLLGHVRVTQAFLPLLRKGKPGRIVNVASCAGRLATSGLGAYAASKFAMEGWSDSLRREVYQQGISVSIIEPWFCATDLVAVKALEENATHYWNKASKELQSVYGGERLFTKIRNDIQTLPNDYEPPQRVVCAIQQALFSPWPRCRYSGTRQGQTIGIPLSWLSAEIQDPIMKTLSTLKGVPGGWWS